MKTVIVPVDFSEAAYSAAEFAGSLAAFYGAELLLYHAYELPVTTGDFSYPVADAPETQSAAEHDMEMFKEGLQNKLKKFIKINTQSELNALQDGLTELCDRVNPDLIVIGLSPGNAFTRLMLGSNTVKTVYGLKYPVLVVPPAATFKPVRKIGFACDYKEIEKNTPFDLLKKIVHDFNAELHVLNVDYNNRNFSPGMLEESFVLGKLLSDIKPEYHNIESEDVTEGINWFAEKANLDMIIVIPKKYDLVQRLFTHHSHTRDLIFHTHTPVLCIHQ